MGVGLESLRAERFDKSGKPEIWRTKVPKRGNAVKTGKDCGVVERS
jgi:hypothetical protein